LVENASACSGAWPTAWHGQNLRDIVTTLGHDVDTPWRDLPRSARDWLLFTDEQPVVPVYPGATVAEVRRARRRREPPDYQGTFTSARRYVLQTFATTESASIRRRVAQYLVSSPCPVCHGKRLRPESLSVTFAGRDIAEMSQVPLERLAEMLRPYADGTVAGWETTRTAHPDTALVTERVTQDLCGRLAVLLDLGLGYLTLERSTPTLSPGELQRLRLATQVRSNLFWRRLRPRRAVGWPAPGRHRGAAARARWPQGLRQLAVRRRARPRRDSSRGLDRRRRTGRW